MKKMGGKIKELRKAKGLTLRNLAGLTDMTVSHLSLIQNGLRNGCPKTLWRIALALDTTVDFLLDDSRDKMDLEMVEDGWLAAYIALSPESKRLIWNTMKFLQNKED